MGLVWNWLTDPANWQGPDGIPLRLFEHLWYSALALSIAFVIAVPVGLYVGHTGRGRFLAVNLAGALRAVPSLGLLFVAIMVLGPHLGGELYDLVPTQLVLVVLAVPPILAGVYAGVGEVDAAAKDAARGMGMTEWELLTQVEIPCAWGLMMSGLRSAALQVIATATLAATIGMGGLGRFLIDGLAVRDYAQMAGGAVLVAFLAVLVDLVLATTARLLVSPGITGKTSSRPPRAKEAQP